MTLADDRANTAHCTGSTGTATRTLDDLVDAAEAARMLGYASRYVIHANRRLRYFPA